MDRLLKGGRIVDKFAVLLTILFATFGKVWSVEKEHTNVSSLVAEAATYLIGKLQGEQSNFIQDDGSSFPQTRGGGWSGGGHGHGAITLDPVSIISLLALGAFLINNILQLLRANMNNNNMNMGGGRSLPDNPFDNLALLSSSLNALHNSPANEGEPGFIEFFKNVGSLYYLQPKKRHMCMKRVVCNYINTKESREKNPTALKTRIFDFMLSTVTKIVAPEIDEKDKEEKCMKMQKFCSDALLKDARISVEYKIYSQVSNWLTKLAFNGLAKG